MDFETDWKPVHLRDLVSIRHGFPFRGQLMREELTGGPIVVNIGNFDYQGGFRFQTTTVREYRGAYPHDYELRPDEILLVMTCQTPDGEILGLPARVPNDGQTYLHNQRLGRVVPRPGLEVDENFLYYLFLSPAFNLHLFTTASGSKILHTSPDRIESFEFRLPPLPEQVAIGEILRPLDEKIELNRRMIQTIEGIARAVFRSWFVGFEPVRAKIEGRQPHEMDAETTGLFPSSFEEPSAGLIPSGWRWGSIADIATYVNGRNFTKDATGSGRMVIRIAELNSGPSASTVFNEVDAESANIAQPDDILFAWSGSLGVYRWHRDEALINQHIFKVICDEFPQWFVFYQLQESMDYFREIASHKATTMGHIKRGHLAEVAVPLPPDEMLTAAGGIIGPTYRKIHVLERESQTLAALRDMLIPKLISGEIRIRDAELMAEATVGR